MMYTNTAKTSQTYIPPEKKKDSSRNSLPSSISRKRPLNNVTTLFAGSPRTEATL